MFENKRRLYAAYFHRKSTPEFPSKFHVGILVAPKNPNTKRDKRMSHLYHVMNSLETETGKELWKFEHWPTQELRCETRFLMFAGTMLLGKLQSSVSDDDIYKLMCAVPRITWGEENPSWRCTTWVEDAISTLVSADIIPLQPAPAHDIIANGVKFMSQQPFTSPSDALPACNAAGEAIPSEMRSASTILS